MKELRDKEAGIEELIREGKTAAAVEGLYELIIAYAEIMDFARAEVLRDRLYHVDPMAIRELAQSGDFIEMKKRCSPDTEHMQLWSELYSELTQEEASALYYSLIRCEFQPEYPLFREGDTDRTLYFLEKGLLRLSFHKRHKEMYITTLGPGDTIGAETFFARSRERTFTATPLTPVKANALYSSAQRMWKQGADNVRSVLYAFCYRNNSFSGLQGEDMPDRRSMNRIRVNGTLAVRVLDSLGNPVSRPFRGELRDISSQGISFNNSLKDEVTAQSLLGRRIAVISTIQTDGARETIKKVGQVVAVQSHPFREFTFHIRFDRPIPENRMWIFSVPRSVSDGASTWG